MSRVWPDRWLRWSAHPFGGGCAGAWAVPCFCSNTLLLLPAPQKWQLGFFGLYLVYNLPQLRTCAQLSSVPSRFFVFCCSRRHLSRHKHCSTGPQALEF